jgi:hypothetical protein
MKSLRIKEGGRATIARAAWVVALVATSGVATAQTTAPGDSANAPAARPADVRSGTAIVAAAYDAISGPAGPRDWERFYSLFAPDARLIQTQRDSTGATRLHPMTPQDFARVAGEYFSKHAFYEGEIGRESNTFGAVTQVFSAYASRHAANDPKPFARGINSFQLFNDGKRWYIVTIYWDAEHPGVTIPDRYLHVGQ